MWQRESGGTNAAAWKWQNNAAVWVLQHKCCSVKCVNAAAYWLLLSSVEMLLSECELCDDISCINFAAQMHWYKWMLQRECCSVRGQGGACTHHEVARMSLTINEALGLVLDEALVHALIHSVACSGFCWGTCSCPCWGPVRFSV